jgi:hypothetical protein
LAVPFVAVHLSQLFLSFGPIGAPNSLWIADGDSASVDTGGEAAKEPEACDNKALNFSVSAFT